MSSEPAPYLRLSPRDNIVVLTRPVEPGEVIAGEDSVVWRIVAPLGPGNKLATRQIDPGEQVFKYGFPIGTATAAIEPGAHVHTHNMRSNYIQTDIDASEARHAR